LATVSDFALIEAEPRTVLQLLADYSRRERLMPDGWRFLGLLPGPEGGRGSRMEIEARVGPAPLTYVIELLELEDDRLVDGTQAGSNYVTTWTVQPHEAGSAVWCEMQFEYGGLIGEFFAGRRLRKALQQQLGRLKRAAETAERHL
jgi:hypothetical protein